MLLLPICVASEDFPFSFFHGVSSPVGVSVTNRVMWDVSALHSEPCNCAIDIIVRNYMMKGIQHKYIFVVVA